MQWKLEHGEIETGLNLNKNEGQCCSFKIHVTHSTSFRECNQKTREGTGNFVEKSIRSYNEILHGKGGLIKCKIKKKLL